MDFFGQYTLPLAEGESAAVPYDVAFCHAFYESFSVLVITLNICNPLRHILVPNSRKKIEYPVQDPVPGKLPCWKCPWPRGAVLQCPGIFYFPGTDMST